MLLLSASNFATGNNIGTFSTTLAFVVNNRIPSRLCHPDIRIAKTPSSSSLHMSSIGGGNEDNNKDNSDDNPLNEWIKRNDSENVRQVREQFAEGRLPISYGAMNTDEDNQQQNNNENGNSSNKFGPLQNNTEQTSNDDAIDATSTSSSSSGLSRNKPNPYLNVVSRLTPSDLISRFTSSASPRVQDAVRTTVLGLIGGLPQMAFDTKTIATGERLASLMFQLQMTGYMFKNAEYRLSLSQSLGRSDRMLPGGVDGNGDDDAKALGEGTRLKGKIKVRYGATGNNDNSEPSDDPSDDTNKSEDDNDRDQQPKTSFSAPGMEVEVDAQAYMSELRGEVSRLREELDATKQAKEEELRKDLLMYIRTLPQQELRGLTGTMSPEVLEAMKGLVTAVLAGIGEDEEGGETGLGDIAGGGSNVNKIGPNTVTEQSGEALAQLCMWQLVVGFNLRELEVREEFRASMKNMLGEGGVDGSSDEESDSGGVGFGPGALE